MTKCHRQPHKPKSLPEGNYTDLKSVKVGGGWVRWGEVRLGVMMTNSKCKGGFFPPLVNVPQTREKCIFPGADWSLYAA